MSSPRHPFLSRWPALLVLCAVPLWTGCGDARDRPTVQGGQADRGKEAIQRYGCVSCHTVPGVAGLGANVGPPLTHLSERGYLAGLVANTPDNLVRWLRHPTRIDPRTAMPDLGLSEAEARDIAAYLYERT